MSELDRVLEVLDAGMQRLDPALFQGGYTGEQVGTDEECWRCGVVLTQTTDLGACVRCVEFLRSENSEEPDERTRGGAANLWNAGPFRILEHSIRSAGPDRVEVELRFDVEPLRQAFHSAARAGERLGQAIRDAGTSADAAEENLAAVIDRLHAAADEERRFGLYHYPVGSFGADQAELQARLHEFTADFFGEIEIMSTAEPVNYDEIVEIGRQLAQLPPIDVPEGFRLAWPPDPGSVWDVG